MSPELVAIILFSVWGCGMTCYHLGRQVGIQDAVEHMANEGMIELDE